MLNEVHNIVKMIGLIKNRPAIYDNTLEEHNNRMYVECLWNEVEKEMGPGITASDCRRKWASLRNALARDYRNEKEASLNQRKKKKWYLADHLSFLRNTIAQRSKKEKGPQESDEEEDNSTTQEDKTLLDFSSQVVSNEYLSEETNEMDTKPSLASLSSGGALNENKPLYIVIAPQQKQPPLPLPKLQQQSSSPPLSAPTVPSTTSYEIENHNMMETSSTKRSRSADEKKILDDRNMTFFKSIIPDLLRLSERQQRLYKQNVLLKLNRLLDE